MPEGSPCLLTRLWSSFIEGLYKMVSYRQMTRSRDVSNDGSIRQVSPDSAVKIQPSLRQTPPCAAPPQAREQWAGFINQQLVPLIDSDNGRNELLKFLNRDSPEPFQFAFPDHQYTSVRLLHCGSYSSIYRAWNSTTEKEVILKVIRVVPMGAREKLWTVNFASAITYEQAHREVLISTIMSSYHNKYESINLHSFVKVLATSLVKGPLPENFDSREDTSELLAAYPSIPLEHVIIEMSDGGQEFRQAVVEGLLPLEGAISCIKQLVFALWVAESCNEFEHRDLHSRNVLVKRTKKDMCTIRVNDYQYEIQTFGWKVKIIDYSYARALIGNGIKYSTVINPAKKPRVVRLEHEAYLQMTKLVGPKWNKFCPKSNCIWLCYLIQFVMQHVDKLATTTMNSDQVNDYSKMLEQLNEIGQQSMSASEMAENILLIPDPELSSGL